MDQNQRNKAAARDLWARLDTEPEAARPLLGRVARWDAPAPIGPCAAADVIDRLFAPLRASIPDLRRQTHLFLGGQSDAKEAGPDGTWWVAGTGYYTGHASKDVFGIPATPQALRIRWGEFLQFDADGHIIAAQTIWDFVDWFEQIGRPVLPPPRGAQHVYPAPTGYMGQRDDVGDPATSEATLALGRDFIFGGLNAFDESDLSSMGMARYFHPNIKWYGPGGIGACFSLAEFETFHQQPWLTAFPDRKILHLESLFAEDRLLAASGPRGVIATHTGPYLGEPASDAQLEVSGIDFWMRQGDVFTENWVFVDMIHLFGQMGVDLFDRLKRGERVV